VIHPLKEFPPFFICTSKKTWAMILDPTSGSTEGCEIAKIVSVKFGIMSEEEIRAHFDERAYTLTLKNVSRTQMGHLVQSWELRGMESSVKLVTGVLMVRGSVQGILGT